MYLAAMAGAVKYFFHSALVQQSCPSRCPVPQAPTESPKLDTLLGARARIRELPEIIYGAIFYFVNLRPVPNV